ncbi:MAG: hypothetical protein ABIH76_07310, partial [Candidatus Bathyarchaeota archaeon]
GRSIIDHVEGFSINYAKRIESSSRIGKYSKVFVSREVASLLEGDPIVFAKHRTSLKGIEHDEDVFEVRSAFFKNMPLDNEILDTEEFINAYSNVTPQTDLIREPWLKGLIISVLNSRADAAKDNVLKNRYLEKISNFAWQKPVEDDPIMLFWRARECLSQNNLTKSLTYLKRIVEMYPYFIHARKKMVETCWEIANTAKECSELVFARDTAQEFLTRYPDYLTDTEKKKFKEILNRTSRTKRKKR